MFVHKAANPVPGPYSLGDLGMTSGLDPIVCLNEFNYKKRTKIYGDAARERDGLDERRRLVERAPP